MLDVPLSLTIAKEIEAEKKECWYHALRAFFLYEELQSGWYVEGWAIPDKGIPLNIEHGWIERTNGSIIDPTWAMLGNKDVKYFPGIRYTFSEVAELAQGKKSVQLPLVSRNGVNPLTHLGYLEAYKASFKAATGKDFDMLRSHLKKAKSEAA